MAEEDTTGKGDNAPDDSDEDAQNPLPDVDPDDDDDGDEDDSADRPSARDGDNRLRDAGKQALDRMKRQRNAARQELLDLRKEIEDKNKSESQRMAEAVEDAKSKASKAEQNFLKLQTALDRAPEGATLKQIQAVAKRLSGDDQDELDADADELFALFAPASEKGKPPAGKPKERLRGGGDPNDEPEEMNPRKLADLIGRP